MTERVGPFDVEIAAAGALFHFPQPLRKLYGEPDRLDGGTALDVLRWVIEFVNGALDPSAVPAPDTVGVGPGPDEVGLRELQSLLEAAVADDAKCAAKLYRAEISLARPTSEELGALTARARHIKWWPAALERTALGVQWRHHAFIESPEQLQLVVAIMLMDASVRKRVGRCKRCGRFFLVGAPDRAGRPERFYCSERHRKEANDADAPIRQRRLRASRLLQKKRFRSDAIDRAVRRIMAERPEIVGAKELAEHAEQLLRRGKR